MKQMCGCDELSQLLNMRCIFGLRNYNYEGQTKWYAECSEFPSTIFFGDTPKEALLKLKDKLNSNHTDNENI